eukprot:14656646-Heterocapsa_arctica.AAC.1
MEALRLLAHLGKDSAGTAKMRSTSKWTISGVNEASEYLRNPDEWLQAGKAARQRDTTRSSSSRFNWGHQTGIASSSSASSSSAWSSYSARSASRTSTEVNRTGYR